MIIKRLLYIRSGPYKVNLNSYNLQEVGFSKELCKRGIDCDIVYYSDEDKDEIVYENEGNKVTILWRKGIKILRTGIYPQILNKDFLGRYDLILATEYSQIMSLMCTKYNQNVIIYNGPYYNLFKVPFMESIYDLFFVKKINENTKKIFAKSNLSKHYLEKKGLINIDVLGVGLDIEKFNNKVDITPDIEKIIDYMKKNRCLLYVGSLDERKNFRFTLKVFEQINKVNFDIKLVVIGSGKKLYVKESFKLLNKKTIDNILHIDRIDNKYLKYIYSEAEVFLLPSKLEIFGMVLLESMYFGAPTVTSLNGGSTTLIENKKNGVIVEKFCENMWVDEIIELLENDNYRNTIKVNSINTIKNFFTWEKICDKFIGFLE